MDRSVEGIANEIKAVSAALQLRKNALSEFHKVNLAVSRIAVKITAGPATQTQSAVSAILHHTSHTTGEMWSGQH